MKHKQLVSILTFSIFIWLTGCDVINPAETIPAIITMDSVEVITFPGQGTARHKITEVWTLADNELIGTYPVGADIHYIADKPSAMFSFRPGIRNNGILDDAIIYPMLTHYNLDINTTPGIQTNVKPVFQYKPDAVFSLIADFETQNEFSDNRDTVPESEMVRTDIDPFEGNYSGEMVLNSEAFLVEVGNALALTDLPTDGTSAYLEFHYKSEVAVSVGLLGLPVTGQSFENYFYVLLPSDKWNKIYLELTDYLVVSDLPAYKIIFGAAFPQGGADTYKIQLDNIKVVHL